ncbi:uncharacterized protein [Gossypium hirsutum]|uniref:Uncharacterized protein n=1 Tax=Gossypium hirsutum TaxID=3635 RepID=A0ABM3BAP0_GOSHI|nr:uncharacterized protein LOC121224617 [Gossypium hirsutum]
MSLDLLTELLLDCEARQLDILTEVPMQANVTSYSKNSHSSKSTDGSNSYGSSFRQCPREHGRGWFRGRSRSNSRGWTRSRPQCQLCGKVGHVVQTCYHRFNENFSGVDTNDSKTVNYHSYEQSSSSCCNFHSQAPAQASRSSATGSSV